MRMDKDREDGGMKTSVASINSLPCVLLPTVASSHLMKKKGTYRKVRRGRSAKSFESFRN